MKVYWSPIYGDVAAGVTRLLLACRHMPRSRPFDPGNAKPDHHAVMQSGAAETDASAKTHDRIAVNAGQPLNRADRQPSVKAAMTPICLSRESISWRAQSVIWGIGPRSEI